MLCKFMEMDSSTDDQIVLFGYWPHDDYQATKAN